MNGCVRQEVLYNFSNVMGSELLEVVSALQSNN